MALTGRFNFKKAWRGRLSFVVEEKCASRWGGEKRRWRRGTLADLAEPRQQRPKALGGQISPCLPHHTQGTLILLLRALGELAGQCRPRRGIGVDQSADRVRRDWPDDALRLPDGLPEFGRLRVVGKLDAFPDVVCAAAGLEVEVLASPGHDAVNASRQ